MSTPLIHPTAIISGEASLAPDVIVGPYSVVEGAVVLGSGCHVGPHCHLIGPLRAGEKNRFHTGCVIGDDPQHLAYRGETTGLTLGDRNTFREHVTIHRGMPKTDTNPAAGETRIGNDNFFMVGSHVAHDCRVGDRCIFANSAVIGGHAVVGDGAFLSGNSCVHQFCRVGRLAMISGTTSISQDLPPFYIVQNINVPRGVNVVGMRRAGIPAAEILAVRRAYRILNLQQLTVKEALERIESDGETVAAVREMIDFIRTSKRGIVTSRTDKDDEA